MAWNVRQAVRGTVLAGLWLAAAPSAAQAQENGGQRPPTPQPGTETVVVERVDSGLAGGPDVRVTEVNGRHAVLVGACAGWLMDNRLLIGGGGYWLADNRRDLQMAYGGAVVAWYLLRDHVMDVSVRGLVGGGRARLAVPWGGPVPQRWASFGQRGGMPETYPPLPYPSMVVFEQDFFVFEPQLDLVWHITRGVALTGGAGYRVIGAASGLEDRLRGLSGTVAIRFGGR